MGDLEGRGGREGGLLTVLSILPIDWPCIQRVTCGSMDVLSPIVLRAHHPFGYSRIRQRAQLV